ncbi:MAG: hypothetical protein VX218_08830 [Pseudomonadota bacterium]|nr:hypothetical protein [Pseudomonadota bacterium]
MSDPFASALDAIFHGPGSEAAELLTIYGQRIPNVRIIRTKTDREMRFGDGQMNTAKFTVDIRRAQAPKLSEGDRLFVGTTVNEEFVPAEELALTGEPTSDVEGITWTIGYEAVEPMR